MTYETFARYAYEMEEPGALSSSLIHFIFLRCAATLLNIPSMGSDARPWNLNRQTPYIATQIQAPYSGFSS